MRVTVFELESDEVVHRRTERPQWRPYEEWEGEKLTGVERAAVVERDEAVLELVRIAAGGHFVMHAAPAIAHCQVISGKGTLALPGGTELRYDGPELYVFLPDTLHEWKDIEEDTHLSVCVVPVAAGS
ncbi:MAG TPA: hypothetical protein VMM81_01200 [Acidimicrobiia bacterium]|nr:hypothetical protein [Acidimicrobiia bacterium]